jgi:hypothetical protein
MKKYEVLKAVTFETGRYKLTDEQLARRRHVVKIVDKKANMVEPKPQISFKKGETIETDLEVTKGMLGVLLDPVAGTVLPPALAVAPVPAADSSKVSPPAPPHAPGGEATTAAEDPLPLQTSRPSIDDPLAGIPDAPPATSPAPTADPPKKIRR